MSESKKVKRKLHRRKLAALLFLMMLGIICLLNLVSGDKEYSEKENRMLQQRPQFTLAGIESGRLMEQYESYLSDQFIG
ncbi:MAG: hypothetical protein ACI4V6_01685, partial [Dorea sp.]